MFLVWAPSNQGQFLPIFGQCILRPFTFFTDCTAPFTVGVVTDAIDEADNSAPAVGARGICLEYTQIPCV